MKIGIPIFDLVNTIHLSGVEKYTYNLLVNMIKLDSNNNFIIYQGFRQEPGRFSEFKTRRVIQRFLPRQMRAIAFGMDRLNILHLPVYFDNIPYLKNGKNILTIHDLVPLFNPEISMEGLSDYYNRLKNELYKIDMFIAVSEHTKKDIMKYLDVPEHKIRVIYEAADESYKPVKDHSGIKKKYGLDKFILSVGTLEPRKNIPNLIKAFGKLNRRDYKLVITGKKGWKYEEIFRLVESLGLGDRIKFLGYILDEELPALYSAAELFVYPSLYEGFGLPPLEAMACGTPVIVSNRSSLPEVVGDAGILIDPEDTDGIAEAMEKILQQPSLRKELSEKGLQQAKKFSWSKCASETIELYKQIYLQNQSISDINPC